MGGSKERERRASCGNSVKANLIEPALHFERLPNKLQSRDLRPLNSL